MNKWNSNAFILVVGTRDANISPVNAKVRVALEIGDGMRIGPVCYWFSATSEFNMIQHVSL